MGILLLQTHRNSCYNLKEQIFLLFLLMNRENGSVIITCLQIYYVTAQISEFDVTKFTAKLESASEHGCTTKAIEHFLIAADWPNAARFITKESDVLVKRGENATLVRWTNLLPQDIMQANPALCLNCAWALALSGQEDEAEAIYNS